MLKLNKPDKPSDFDDKSKENLDKIERQINEGEKPDFNERFWKKYKDKFFEAQNRKCSYCECLITDYGDVEHYCPKSVVEEIEQEGEERENLNTVKGRTFKQVCESGYWWLAYDWNNYLLSCSLCNQPWKRALFPIGEERPENDDPDSEYPYRSPKKGDEETPLLLNPYDEECNPYEHLIFTKIGLIKPKNDSRIGIETIRTYGLHRLQLIESRSRYSMKVHKFITRFALTEEGTKANYEAAQDIVDMGSEKDQHAGMVRIIFESRFEEYSWEDLENYVEQKRAEFLDE